MKKNMLFAAICCLASSFVFAQVNNDGAFVYVSSGTLVYTDLDVRNSNSATLTNQGSLTTTGSFTNESGSHTNGSGTYNISGDWTNSGSFTAESSTVIFNDTDVSSVTSGNAAFYNLDINKTTSNDVTLLDNAAVTNSLNFTSDKNKLNIGTNNLSMASLATITGYDDSDYIVTGSTGYLIKETYAGNFEFPVGFDSNTYNPISVSQGGTPDNINVRCLENVLENGLTGAVINDDVATVSWEVTEDVAGGSDLTLTAQWESSDQQATFDINQSSIHEYTTYWEPGIFGAATGADPYQQSRSDIAAGGIFAVGGFSLQGGLKLNLGIFLEGPYNGALGMNDNLRAASYIPATEPYTDLGFTHVFRGGGEMVSSTVLAITGTTAVVDWVFVELRDTDETTVIATKSALLLADGSIVDLDGSSSLTFDGVNNGDYFVVVDHRNHLGVMTPATLALSRTATPFDFTDGTAYGTLGSSQKMLPDGTYGLWTADLDQSGGIDAADRSAAWNGRNQSGYLKTDATMDGNCDASDRSKAWNNRNKSSAVPQ